MRIPNTLVIVSAGAEVRSDTSRFARNANIVKLIKMLQAQVASAAVMTRERRMALLSKQTEAEAKKRQLERTHQDC